MSDLLVTREFGEPVEFHVWLRRGSGPTYRDKRWLQQESPSLQHGIIVGKRTISNGSVEWEDNSYSPKEFFQAYIVVCDMRSKPVYVLPEHLFSEGETHA